MYQCINNDGLVVATYANESEARTYWNQSVEHKPADYIDVVRDGEITVFDATNTEVGSIKLPKSH